MSFSNLKKVPFRTHRQTLQDKMFMKMFFSKSTADITPEEVEYFRDHKDEIDEVARPLNIHKYFLIGGLIAGICTIGLSKFLNYSGMLGFFGTGLREFVVDIVFELGVALLGATATAYLLGVLLNRQQRNAIRWRIEINRLIQESENSGGPGGS